MILHPDVLAAHAEFGGDLESMQKLYEYPDLKAEVERLRSAVQSPKDNAAGWKIITDDAKTAGRILLLWVPTGGLGEHVELGYWSAILDKWVNTYGKAFSAAPDRWATLAPFIDSAPPQDNADDYRCPICAEPLKASDICASDITEGTCHAECLAGSPVVDLDTGDEIPGCKIDTYPYREVMEPPAAYRCDTCGAHIVAGACDCTKMQRPVLIGNDKPAPKDKMTMNTEEKFVRVIATLIEVLKRQVKREDREQAIEKLNQAERLFLRYFLSSVITPDEIDRCPICAAAFKADDVCASDITEGTCHAACLEGSPVVDLETGKETGGKVDTYRYSEVMEPAPKDNLEWSEERSRGALKFIAHGTCGKYTIVSCRPGWRLHLPLFGDEPRFFGYLETAMSAAQADDGILSLEVRVIAEVAKIDRRLSEINEALGQGPREDWMRPLEEEFAFLRGRRSILRPNGIPQENGRPQ